MVANYQSNAYISVGREVLALLAVSREGTILPLLVSLLLEEGSWLVVVVVVKLEMVHDVIHRTGGWYGHLTHGVYWCLVIAVTVGGPFYSILTDTSGI